MQNSYKVGATDTRPWGEWRVMHVGEDYVLKEIKVNAGGILSLQRHQYRSEKWSVMKGHGVVTVADRKIRVKVGSEVFIPKKAWHRIENTGWGPLVFQEMQIGEILDENDIERKEDKYNRV